MALNTHVSEVIGLSSGISTYPAMTFQNMTCVVASTEEYGLLPKELAVLKCKAKQNWRCVKRITNQE